MTTIKKYKYAISTIVLLTLITFVSCERETDELELATYPTTADIFIDGFSPGLDYNAWGDVTNFSLDNEVTYKGSASMRFAVPNEGDTGAFAGGNFFTILYLAGSQP